MLEKTVTGLDKILIFAILFTLIFGQRFAFTLVWQFPIIFFVMVFAVIVLYLFGRITMDQNRLFLFVLASLFALIASMYSLVHMNEPSINPLVYLILFYFPFIFVYKNPNVLDFVFSLYQRFMLIVAIAGILQFVLQLNGIGFIDPLYDVNNQFYLANYNTKIPLYFGSDLYKSNGMFMLEPSFYSKFIAVAIIIEFLTFKRKKFFLIYSIAFLFAFSGTGGIILLIACLPILSRLPLKQVLLFGSMIIIPVYFFFDSGYGLITLERLSEFENPYSSGYIRFIAPYLAFNEFLLTSSPAEILLGTGPATLDQFEGIQYSFNTDSLLYEAHENAFIKLFIEYGMIGGLFFSIFILYCFFSSTRNMVLTICLFVNYTFLTGALIQAQTVYISFILSMLFATGYFQKSAEEKENINLHNPKKLMNQLGKSKGEYV